MTNKLPTYAEAIEALAAIKEYNKMKKSMIQLSEIMENFKQKALLAGLVMRTDFENRETPYSLTILTKPQGVLFEERMFFGTKEEMFESAVEFILKNT